MAYSNSTMSLYGRSGQRKYLTSEERKRFYNTAKSREKEKQLFLLALFYTGARISEILNLKIVQIDADESVVIIECLKKRKKGIYRAIPIPMKFLNDLSSFIESSTNKEKIFSYPRRTATRFVKHAMIEANIKGTQACSKGLRHSFAVAAIQQNVPLNLIKTWMGHSSIAITEIYLNVVGKEERAFAERMW